MLQVELLRNELHLLLFIGSSTSARAPQTPKESTLGPIRNHHVEGGGSADLKAVRPTPCGPGWPYSLARWLVCGPSGVFSVDVRNEVSLGPRGPFNPCDGHVSSSDSLGCASLGLMTWLACMDSCVVAPHWLKWCGMDRRRWVCHFFMFIFLQSNNLKDKWNYIILS
jgi:hypothetical protein